MILQTSKKMENNIQEKYSLYLPSHKNSNFICYLFFQLEILFKAMRVNGT